MVDEEREMIANRHSETVKLWSSAKVTAISIMPDRCGKIVHIHLGQLRSASCRDSSQNAERIPQLAPGSRSVMFRYGAPAHLSNSLPIASELEDFSPELDVG